MKQNLFLALVIIITFSCKKTQDVAEVLSNNLTEYKKEYDEISRISSVKIGRQRWMTKNLDVTKYRNGDKIPQVKDSAAWPTLTTGAWCYYKNDPSSNEEYGKLYNWYAVNDERGLAPEGWRVASKEDWDNMILYLGGDTIAGGKLKEIGTAHWYLPNTGATNSTGFSALPGGYRFYGFDTQGYISWHWSSSYALATPYSWFYHIYNEASITYTGYSDKAMGMSVRCIKE